MDLYFKTKKKLQEKNGNPVIQVTNRVIDSINSPKIRLKTQIISLLLHDKIFDQNPKFKPENLLFTIKNERIKNFESLFLETQSHVVLGILIYCCQ